MPQTLKKSTCRVPCCQSEWLISSKRILQYCEDHHYLALDLYNQYKDYTKKALEFFDDHNLKMAIKLRTKYDTEFVGGDCGAHRDFVILLKKILASPFRKRKSLSIYLINEFNKIYPRAY